MIDKKKVSKNINFHMNGSDFIPDIEQE